MKNMRLLLCLLLAQCLGGYLTAQAPAPRKAVAIHLGKPFYVSGEIVWYKIYLPTAFAGEEVTLKVALPAFKGQTPIQFIDLRNDSFRVNLEDEIFLANAPTLPYLPEDGTKTYEVKW